MMRYLHVFFTVHFVRTDMICAKKCTTKRQKNRIQESFDNDDEADFFFDGECMYIEGTLNNKKNVMTKIMPRWTVISWQRSYTEIEFFKVIKSF